MSVAAARVSGGGYKRGPEQALPAQENRRAGCQNRPPSQLPCQTVASWSTPRLLLALLPCRSLGATGTAYLDLPKGQGVESGWVVFVG